MGDQGQTKPRRFFKCRPTKPRSPEFASPIQPGCREGGGGRLGDGSVAGASSELAVRAGLPARCWAERFAERRLAQSESGGASPSVLVLPSRLTRGPRFPCAFPVRPDPPPQRDGGLKAGLVHVHAARLRPGPRRAGGPKPLPRACGTAGECVRNLERRRKMHRRACSPSRPAWPDVSPDTWEAADRPRHPRGQTPPARPRTPAG